MSLFQLRSFASFVCLNVLLSWGPIACGTSGFAGAKGSGSKSNASAAGNPSGADAIDDGSSQGTVPGTDGAYEKTCEYSHESSDGDSSTDDSADEKKMGSKKKDETKEGEGTYLHDDGASKDSCKMEDAGTESKESDYES